MPGGIVAVLFRMTASLLIVAARFISDELDLRNANILITGILVLLTIGNMLGVVGIVKRTAWGRASAIITAALDILVSLFFALIVIGTPYNTLNIGSLFSIVTDIAVIVYLMSGATEDYFD